jgi:hypothetical protein
MVKNSMLKSNLLVCKFILINKNKLIKLKFIIHLGTLERCEEFASRANNYSENYALKSKINQQPSAKQAAAHTESIKDNNKLKIYEANIKELENKNKQLELKLNEAHLKIQDKDRKIVELETASKNGIFISLK